MTLYDVQDHLVALTKDQQAQIKGGSTTTDATTSSIVSGDIDVY